MSDKKWLFTIVNSGTGLSLGQFWADNSDAALTAWAKSMGHASVGDFATSRGEPEETLRTRIVPVWTEHVSGWVARHRAS